MSRFLAACVLHIALAQLLLFAVGCGPRAAPETSQPAASTNVTAIDLEKATGIAELYNLGSSPHKKQLLVLGLALRTGGQFPSITHEAWLIDLQSQPPTAKKLFSDDKADCEFAWSPDGRTLLTHLNGVARYWNVADGVETVAPNSPAEALPNDVVLGPEFSAADKLLQQSGFQAGRGWLTDFSPHGAACCPVPGFTLHVTFAGRPAEQEADTGAWWLRFAPDEKALFWVAKDPAGTLYRVTPEDTFQLQAASSAQSRVARLDKLFAIGKHGAEVRSAVIRSDGKQVVTAGMDGMVRAWDVARRKLAAEVNGIADLPVQAAELWGMELSEGSTHLIVYAQPLEMSPPVKPGRMWLVQLTWPTAIEEGAAESTPP